MELHVFSSEFNVGAEGSVEDFFESIFVLVKTAMPVLTRVALHRSMARVALSGHPHLQCLASCLTQWEYQ